MSLQLLREAAANATLAVEESKGALMGRHSEVFLEAFDLLSSFLS